MDWMMLLKQYGPSTCLVIYVLFKNEQRETKYLAVIQTLSEEVKDRLTKIERRIGRRGGTDD